jgi:hypothetical protein
MDKSEARSDLRRHMARYRTRSYTELVAAISRPEVCETPGESGTGYQIEIQVMWDDKRQRNLRVLGAIDDGGLRAFLPLCEDFVMAPDGTILDEA